MDRGILFFNRVNGKCQIVKRLRTRGNLGRFGFTLIELLVVISVISLLLAILVPVFGRAKEQARRMVCSNHVRQFIAAIHIYAHDDEGWFPSGLSDHGDDEYIPVLSHKIRDMLAKITGDHRILSCPWLKEPFTDPDGWFEHSHGYVIGYNYLGGHEGTPWDLGQATDEWESPQRSSASGNVEIVTELNAWSPSERKTFAPHGDRGPILQANDSTNPGFGGIPSEEIGAAGGNIGLVDGSVSWKRMSEMKVYQGSRLYSNMCYAAW